jgi:hypothetical protein
MMQQELAGILTVNDLKTHVAHEILLPVGAARLHVRFEHPRGSGLGHMLCLSLFDSNGFRGSGHRDGTMQGGNAVHEVCLFPEAATPGYLAGPLPPGILRVVIHVHRIVPGDACRYRLVVEWDEEPVPAANAARSPAAPRAAPPRAAGRLAWYRGDLHAHTVHSDGDWDIPAFLGEARETGLDFVALTEHNTTSHLSAIGKLSDTAPLVIAGMELTTFRGHALSLGTREWIDWGVLREGGMSRIAGDVRRRGGLLVIAHPQAEGDPVCTGCDWRFDEMMPGLAPAVEVWNGPWAGDSNNERALALWYGWLSGGQRLAATAGSDAHGIGGLRAGVGRNVVWSPGCTEEAILGAIAAGHLYVSAGPALELSAADGGRLVMMGETLAVESAELGVRWEGCPPGSLLRLVGDGGVLDEVRAEGVGTRRWDGKRARWFTVEIRDRAGGLLAVTNPVRLELAGAAS